MRVELRIENRARMSATVPCKIYQARPARVCIRTRHLNIAGPSVASYISAMFLFKLIVNADSPLLKTLRGGLKANCFSSK